MLGMRRTCGMVLKELAISNSNIIIATADMARYFGGEAYSRDIPDQFVDVGIAEQNLIGVAAGMAKEGYTVFAESYATFITSRCLDQIRMNMGYMELPIKLIGVGGGLSDGRFGPSHMALEDIANLRVIPGITILSPADCAELTLMLEKVVDYDKPTYIRLTGGAECPIVFDSSFEFEIGKANCIIDGKEIAIIATGTMVACGIEVVNLLEKNGYSAKLIDMHTLTPLDKDSINELMDYKLIVTMEEHMINGGLGSAVSEYLVTQKKHPVQMFVGIRDGYPKTRDYKELLNVSNFGAEQIANNIIKKLMEI
ncbi:transketolase subunit B TktB1 [Butyrivibrio proteoclasticus B316]|uniref:Transketolase subunit B TktB1 n=1 Tax=Butyrivibrio proteoclasticus (strain ATCC 51982 / DSM 14932 / B316) TaxID=515622 RepID=E0RX18_BUTPB|nr:transketolase C-terminal domain-containing protein [Butyrivibrio proteoclasticus]ADL34926.1 transketolase subunit B TktB1 [Butyrivibrio proteoclasticus B316]